MLVVLVREAQLVKKLLQRARSRSDFWAKAFLSFTMRFGGLAFQFVGAIIVARILGAEGFGAFTYATTWAIFIGMMLALGLGELSIREIPGYLARKTSGPILGFLLTLGITVSITGLIAVVGFSWAETSGILILAPGWKLVAAMAVVHAVVLSLSHILNGFQRILTTQFLETIVRQAIYLSLILLAVWAGTELTPGRVVSLSIFAAFPIFCIMLIVAIRAWQNQELAAAKPEFHLNLWMAGALPVFMTSFANRLQLDLDVLMVGAMLTDYDVGIYRAAARGAMLISIANMIALQIVGPMLSRALAEGQKEEAQRLLRQAAIVSFAAGIPIIFALAVGANIYLGLFGPEFLAARTSLWILLASQATIVLAGADAILLVMLRRERLVMIVTTIGVAMNFGLNYWLIQRWGIEGAAVGSLISMAFVRCVLVTSILRTTRFNTTIAQLLFSRRT